MLSHKRTVAAVAATTAATAAVGVALAQDAPRGLERLAGAQKVSFNGSFVSPLVEEFGDVRVGRGVFIASNTTLIADPQGRICIGDRTNIQDNVQVLVRGGRVPRSRCEVRATQTGRRVSIAHNARIENSNIGDFTFVGFNARLRNVTLGDGAFVLHGVRASNVRIGRDRLVPVGAVIDTQAEADALPRKEEAQAEFQEEVLEVNREFVTGYRRLYRQRGFRGVTGSGFAPRTSFNPGRRPEVGAGSELDNLARLVGEVRLGAGSRVGRRTAIRADEGSPIVIGAGADVRNNVTFHALRGTNIRIGDRLLGESSAVFHGPLTTGDDLRVGTGAVVFRATIGDRVTIGEDALVVGPADDPLEIPDGTVVPEDARVTSQADVDALRR